jgi:nucleoid-associated protein YgaU
VGIDKADRTVALLGPEGDVVEVEVSSEARNFDQIEIGDKVKVEYYEIKRGDTLSGIAKKYYGDPMQYKALFEANREVIEDPDKIYPGQKIRIPTKAA